MDFRVDQNYLQSILQTSNEKISNMIHDIQ